jgi:hypothetical protein
LLYTLGDWGNCHCFFIPAQAASITGKVIGVSDGDTLKVLVGMGFIKLGL